MKKIILTMAALGVSVSGASANTVEFRGAACITSVNAACAPFGWTVGDCMLMRYSPRSLGTNGPATELSLFGQSFSDNYSLATGNPVGTVFQPVVGIHVGRTGYSFSPKMRFTSQSPAALGTSKSVTLAGNITNFDDSTGCTVGFRASGTRRP